MPHRRALLGAVPALLVPGLANAGRSAAPTPKPLKIPPRLRRRFPRVGASGLAWAPPLDRYLVVTDDATDDDEADRRAPVVLTMDRDGRFDDEPLTIDGVERLDGAESICCAGRHHTDRFFLLTSHAANPKGQLRPSRRQLLDLRLEISTAPKRVVRLRAAGRVDLADGDGGLPALLAKSGVAAPQGFQAEAIASFSGALHVGLNAPLDRQGAALLVQLGDPDHVFAGPKLSPGLAQLSRRTRLAVDAGPSGVPQGFSDVVFSGEGVLYATASAPKGAPSDGGGALWSIAPAGRDPKPRLLGRFPGLKPEGLSPTPDGLALAVVFDRGGAAPWWTTWPIAA
jgi:hypothetical protein